MKPNIFFLILGILPFAAGATADKKSVELYITDTQTKQAGIAEIYLDNGLNTKYVAYEDAPKIFDTTVVNPQIYSFTSDGIACGSNGFGDFTKTVAITLGVKTVDSGTFSISAMQISNFDVTSAVLLEDRTQGTLTDLRQGAYNFSINTSGELNDRFFLHLIYPVAVQVTAAGCSNNDGQISIAEDSSLTWDNVLLFNGNDTLIQSLSGVNGNLNFSGLTAGNYNIAFVYGSNTSVKTASIISHQVTVGITVNSPIVAVDQTVQFYSSAVNASEFNWDFGDSSRITGISNPEFSYFEPGNFTVTVMASNEFNCTASATLAMDVQQVTSVNNINNNQINIVVEQKNVVINTSDYQQANYTYELYSLSGQLLMTNPVNAAEVTVSLASQPAGIYVMNVKSLAGNFTKKIFVQ